MYKWNNGVISIDLIPVDRTFKGYRDSDQKLSYDKYISQTLIQDLKDFSKNLEDEIRKRLSNSNVITELDEFEVREMDESSTYNTRKVTSLAQKSRPTSVYCVMKYANGNEDSKPFKIFEVPYMDPFGCIVRNGHNYGVISTINPEQNIVFSDKKKFDIYTNKYKLTFGSKTNPKDLLYYERRTDANTTKYYKITDIIIRMCKESGILDARKLLSKIMEEYTYTLVNRTDFDWSYLYDNSNDKNIDNSLWQDWSTNKFELGGTRSYINEALSIDRGEGKVLSRDVVKDGKILGSKGENVTAKMLLRFKSLRVNEYYVYSNKSAVGTYLAQDVLIYKVKRGTVIPEDLRVYFPEERGDYLSKDYEFDLDKMIRIEENEYINEELYEFIILSEKDDTDYLRMSSDKSNNKYDYDGQDPIIIKVKQDRESKVCNNVFLEESIIGNNHFLVKGEWLYFGEDSQDHSAANYITVYDLLAMQSMFPGLCRGEYLNFISDKDLGLRKKINQFNESAHEAFETVSKRWIHNHVTSIQNWYINRNTSHQQSLEEKLSSLFFTFAEDWWKYLRNEKGIIEEADLTNPVSYISTTNRVNTLAKKHQGTNAMRQLALGFYGKICPYETPGSSKLGLTNSKAMVAKIEDGVPSTPYYRVVKRGSKYYVDTSEMIYMDVHEEEKYRIADITSLEIDVNDNYRICTKETVLARVPNKYSLEPTTVASIDVEYVDFVNVYPYQTLGYSTSCIPFIGSNDSNRVTFGSNMIRQTRPLPHREVAIVSTDGDYIIPRMNTMFQINAEASGTVETVYAMGITVKYDGEDEPVTYNIVPARYGHKSVIVMRPVVREGDRVKLDDVLAESNYVKDGLLALGRNCIIGFGIAKYNYEDGVYARSGLRDAYISYGCKKEEFNNPMWDTMSISHELPTQSVGKLAYIGPNTTAVVFRGRSKHGNIITRNLNPTKLRGFLLSMEEGKRIKNRVPKATLTSLNFNRFTDGDKLANRHGNKGVAPFVQDNSKMPYLNNGIPLDIVYNPIGVGSRMNIGQVKECHLGLAGLVLGIKFVVGSFNDVSWAEIAIFLWYAWEAANEPDIDEVNNKYRMLPVELLDHTKDNITNVRMWKGVFSKNGTAKVIDPETGEYFEGEMVIGVNYINKLVQEIEDKINYRGGLFTESYVDKLDAPTHGTIKRGGQSQGYMEIDNYLSYGAAYYLEELMNERGDNGYRRANMHLEALGMQKLTEGLEEFEKNDIRRSLDMYLDHMLALGIEYEFEDNIIPNDVPEVNEYKYAISDSVYSTGKLGGTRNKKKKNIIDSVKKGLDDI